MAKKIKLHQALIADCLESGAETIKKRENLSAEQILVLENLEKMSSSNRYDLPNKEANEEYRGYACAYWLARAKGHESVANTVSNAWSSVKTGHAYPRDITHLDEMQPVLNDIASAGDIQHLIPLWQLAKHLSLDQDSLRRNTILSACDAGKISVLNTLLHSPEEKVALSHYLTQTPRDYFILMRSACKSGNQKMIEWVIGITKESAQLFKITATYNPLAEACASGNHDAVQYVLTQIPETDHQRAITQAGQTFPDRPNDAIEQACFSGHPQVLSTLLEMLSEEQVAVIFSPDYQPADHHPLNYALGVAITDTIFSKMPASWTETIIDSAVYIEALTMAYYRNELEQANYLLDKVPDEKLDNIFDALNSHLDEQVRDARYDIDQRDKEMFTTKINAYKNLRNKLAQTKLSEVDKSSATTSHTPSSDLPSMRLAQSSLFHRDPTSESEEESSSENTKQKQPAASGYQ